MKTLYETARDSLIVIESIASGSTTTNSLPHLARLAREGLTAIESADRAQQGEPVDGAGGFWRERVAENAAAVAAERGDTTSMFEEFRRLRKIPKTPGYCDGTKYTERQAFYMAIATKAAAPADALYSYMGESGAYELVGTAKAAGELRKIITPQEHKVYRDTASGALYVRIAADFDKRMVAINGAAPVPDLTSSRSS